MEYYSALKRNGILTHPTAWMDIEVIMLSEMSQSGNDKYRICKIPLIWGPLWRKLSTEELMLLNCGVGEDSWEWTARRFNQSVLKEISPDYSLAGLMLKLKLQSFGHLMWRTDLLEKTLMLGRSEGGRRREGQRMRWLDGITDRWTWVWVSSGNCWWTGRPGMPQSVGSHRVGHDWADGQGGLACCSSRGHKESDRLSAWAGLRQRLWGSQQQPRWPPVKPAPRLTLCIRHCFYVNSVLLYAIFVGCLFSH